MKVKTKKEKEKSSRLERKIARKKKRLAKMTPESKVKAAKPLIGFDIGSGGACPPGQKRNIKGSCETKNLRAKKSTVAKMPKFNPNKKRSGAKTTGDPQKRKKLAAEIAALEKKRLKKKKKKSGRELPYSNPRFL